MAPPRRRRQCKVVTKDTSTQTNVSPMVRILSECLLPAVVLEQMDLQQYFKDKVSPLKSSAEEQSTDNVPNNYSVFARPITNKENANSTLLSEKDGFLRTQRISLNSNMESRREHRRKFVKPGPLCYKKKFFTDNDLTIPVMLDEVRTTESPGRNLETIFERNENTPSIDMSSDKPVMKEIGIQTLMDSDQLLVDDNMDPVDNVGDTPVCESSPINEMPHNIRLQFGGVTTIISTRSAEKKSDEHDGSSSDSDNISIKDRKDFERPEYIKIKASTVHIHNHFYKS